MNNKASNTNDKVDGAWEILKIHTLMEILEMLKIFKKNKVHFDFDIMFMGKFLHVCMCIIEIPDTY